MFKRILVALDDSDNCRSVFETALVLAKRTNAHLMLLHILATDEPNDPTLPTVFSHYYPTVSEEVIKRCHEEQKAIESDGLNRLRWLADEATVAGVVTEFTQISGIPSRIICEWAKEWNADLIAIGHRGFSGLREMVLGSVSNYVFHHAPCSVLVVPGSKSDNRPIHGQINQVSSNLF